MKPAGSVDYTSPMVVIHQQIVSTPSASTPSLRTLHAELLRLCARIGYSPPALR